MLIYSLKTRRVLAEIPDGQPFESLYDEPLQSLYIPNPPSDWYNYLINDGELIKMSKLEISEMKMFNRILTMDERYESKMLIKLTPSYDEIKKAENTIEILSILQEVM